MWKGQISNDYVGSWLHEWRGENAFMASVKTNFADNNFFYRFNQLHCQLLVNQLQPWNLHPQLNRRNGNVLNQRDYSAIKTTHLCFIYATTELPIILKSRRYSKIKKYSWMSLIRSETSIFRKHFLH